MYRLSLTVDVDGDAFVAGRVMAALQEAAGESDGRWNSVSVSVEHDEVECLDHPWIDPLDDLHCWCGAKTLYAQPSVPSDGVLHPVCLDHAEDGYVGLEQFDAEEIAQKLGLA
jgi:hypothetical protein